jgi:tetratricopeptide (TPR) repeat protein
MLPRWLRRPVAWAQAILRAIAWVLTRVLSGRGLRLIFLALVLLLLWAGWLRPPLSPDISVFRLPLLTGSTANYSPVAQLYGPRKLVAASPGVMLLAMLAVGAIIAIRRPDKFGVASGLLVCGVIASLASLLFNHPELLSLMDDQFQQRKQLVSVLAETTEPTLRVTDAAPVEDSQDRLYAPDTLLRGIVFLHTHSLLVVGVTALACLLATRGSLGRRLRHLGFWSLAGLVFGALITCPRWTAEWHWSRATAADWRGDANDAERHAKAALANCPELARLERTWIFLGRLDYRRGLDTPVARYFHANQWARNKEYRRAIEETSDLARLDQPTPLVHRWLADLKAELAFEDFHGDRRGDAERGWREAAAIDPDPNFRPLLVATLRSKADQADPTSIASMVDPLIPWLRTDRTMRAVLLAMVGDTFFKAGQFAEARDRYFASQRVFSLPKHVNYRAQRGVLGM